MDLEPLAGASVAATMPRGANESLAGFPSNQTQDAASAVALRLLGAVSVEDALRMHTAEAARAARIDHVTGRLAKKLQADFIVLSSSPFSENGAPVPRVLRAYVDGILVHGV